ncbi:MAG: hypothetical protein ACI8QC_001877 [Planctomycetota bacterium]|jgi:hypothetical protein
MKNILQSTLFALSLLSVASCNLPIGHYGSADLDHGGALLASHEDESGTRRQWRVYPGEDSSPRVDLLQSNLRMVPRIGITVVPLTRERALSVGAEAYSGVWVQGVVKGGPAERAGIAPRDVLLSLGGVSSSSPEHFTDLLLTLGTPGEPLELGMHVRGLTDLPATAAVITVIPDAAEDRSSKTESYELVHSSGVQYYTGLQVAELPGEVAQAIYGGQGPVVIATGVVSGSPAYDAGLRCGDRLLNCDGLPVTSLQGIREAVYARTHGKYPSQPVMDLDGGAGNLQATGRSSTIHLAVDGPLGAHVAEFGVTDTLDDHAAFHIPILVHYRSNLQRRDVSFLDFIFQFGFNYDSWVWPSETREPVRTSRLSILPLGMFQIERRRTSNRYRLFWFINFSTARS